MALEIDLGKYRFSEEIAAGVRGKRVLVIGAGTDGGIGQALAVAAGLNGADRVGLHFHRSYESGLETVEAINAAGGNAFPAQADLTNSSDCWSMRSHVIRMMGGKPPDLVLMNSDRAERGYRLGRPPREVDGESAALRRARVRQAFVDNIGQSTTVLDTKLHGFISMSHLWAGEAQHFSQPLQMVYLSSRQAIDPGPGVPGYVIANFGTLWLPLVLQANLGSGAGLARAFSAALPFIKTKMTAGYADKPQFWQRWQPRLVETYEAAHCLLALLANNPEKLIYQLNVMHHEDDDEDALRATWSEVRLQPLERHIPWSEQSPTVLDPEP